MPYKHGGGNANGIFQKKINKLLLLKMLAE